MKHGGYMKRGFLLILAGVMMLGCFACTDDQEREPSTAPTVPATATASTDATKIPTSQSPSGPTQNPATVDYSKKTLEADTLFAKSKVQGRVVVHDYQNQLGKARRGIALDYTASSIEFTAQCEGDVSLGICGLPAGGTSAPAILLNFYVDGQLQVSRKAGMIRGEVDKVIAKGLSKGLHTFKIERQNEADKGPLFINSVTVNGELGAKPADKDLYIEFIGDSITTAYGNLWPDNRGDVPGSNAPSSSYYQDGTRGYAYLAAKELDADYSIVAQQGIGCYVGLHNHTMTQTYTRTCYQTGKNQTWSFDRVPDVVVINLGTNDMSCGKSDAASIQTGFVNFIKLVQKKNPGAKILWVYGAMISDGSAEIQNAVAAAGGASAGVYAYTNLIANGDGGIGHPSAAAHAQNAVIVAREIRKIL